MNFSALYMQDVLLQTLLAISGIINYCLLLCFQDMLVFVYLCLIVLLPLFRLFCTGFETTESSLHLSECFVISKEGTM